MHLISLLSFVLATTASFIPANVRSVKEWPEWGPGNMAKTCDIWNYDEDFILHARCKTDSSGNEWIITKLDLKKCFSMGNPGESATCGTGGPGDFQKTGDCKCESIPSGTFPPWPYATCTCHHNNQPYRLTLYFVQDCIENKGGNLHCAS